MTKFKVERKSKALLNEFKLGLNTMSAHGFVYFFAESSILEKVFWVVTTFVMIGMSVSWGNTVIIYWRDNPAVLETESTSFPTKNLQEFSTDHFPTEIDIKLTKNS